ncbi:MAG: hypothetical protein IPP81_15950 [Chitinophagaceae bacterium]|nr:hypothetical protein [Chitinophagaceae bacterium]
MTPPANVLVSWTTQSEQNSARFDVERSDDGVYFTKVGGQARFAPASYHLLILMWQTLLFIV